MRITIYFVHDSLAFTLEWVPQMWPAPGDCLDGIESKMPCFFRSFALPRSFDLCIYNVVCAACARVRVLLMK